MNPDQIFTIGDFHPLVRQLSQGQAADYSGTLEEYLRSLLRVVMQRRTSRPSFKLLAHILVEAFSTSPTPFDSDWLSQTDPPSFLSTVDQERPPRHHQFDDVIDMLRYQIADLRRLKEMGELT